MPAPRALPATPGSYLLWLELAEPRELDCGGLGRLRFAAGFYGYCGSARGPGGVAARVGRHLRGEGRRRWHIDFLRAAATVRAVWWSGGRARLECDWARALLAGRGVEVAAPRFGASDCRCASHLLWSTTAPAAGAFRRRWARLEPGRTLPLLRRLDSPASLRSTTRTPT